MQKLIIAIDPGKNGGISWIDTKGEVHAENMGDTPMDILEQIRRIKSSAEGSDCVCYLENVGRGRADENVSALCSFARHCGNLEAFLLAEGIPIIQVLPQKWQKSLEIGKSTDCASKTIWKNKIKAKVQERHPKLKITLKTADAIGILDYAIEKEK